MGVTHFEAHFLDQFLDHRAVVAGDEHHHQLLLQPRLLQVQLFHLFLDLLLGEAVSFQGVTQQFFQRLQFVAGLLASAVLGVQLADGLIAPPRRVHGDGRAQQHRQHHDPDHQPFERTQPFQPGDAGFLDHYPGLFLRALPGKGAFRRQGRQHRLPFIFQRKAAVKGLAGHLPDGLPELGQLDQKNQRTAARGDPCRAEIKRQGDHQRVRAGLRHLEQHFSGLRQRFRHLFR